MPPRCLGQETMLWGEDIFEGAENELHFFAFGWRNFPMYISFNKAVVFACVNQKIKVHIGIKDNIFYITNIHG